MSEDYGIENLTKVLDLVIESGNVSGNIIALPEGKWYEKILPAVKLIDEIASLFSVTWNQVIPEFKDLSDNEKEILKKHFIEKFDIPQDNIEIIIEDSLSLLDNYYKAIKGSIELYNKIKAK